MNGTLPPAKGPAAPTVVRYGVLGFAGVLSMITYLDRACIAQVGDSMKADYHLSPAQWGYLLGAFSLAYALFEIPSGWLGDVYGPRRTLLRIVLWWSLFTALLGVDLSQVALAFWILLVVNFLFGMGEAGAYPNIARALHNWFPVSERGGAQGVVWMAGRFAGGMAPLVVLLLLRSEIQWRHVFWIFGSLGIFWCIAFWSWFRDRPDQNPKVNAAELATIQGRPQLVLAPAFKEDRATSVTSTPVTAPDPMAVSPTIPTWLPPEEEVDIQPPTAPLEPSHADVPWLRMLTSGNLWALCGMYFFSTYGWYFVFFWLPEYLRDECHITPESDGIWVVSLLRGAPLLVGATACLLGGLATDFFIRRTGNRKWGRRLFGMLGHGMCALCFFAALLLHRAHMPWLFVLAIAMGAWCNDLTMGASWASCLDIGGKYSGIVSGCMNSIGNLGQAAVNVLTGLIMAICIHKFGPEGRSLSWQINLFCYGMAYVVAVVLWSVFDASKPLVAEDH
jgi:MFS transporter, ACS family, glucarate transporter